jgi:hypothetical protein
MARAGVAAWAIRRKSAPESMTSVRRPIKVLIITDRTYAFSFTGIANANATRTVIGDANVTAALLDDTLSCTSRTAKRKTALGKPNPANAFGGVWSCHEAGSKRQSGPRLEPGRQGVENGRLDCCPRGDTRYRSDRSVTSHWRRTTSTESIDGAAAIQVGRNDRLCS